jgi:glycosyltransferase involved in cell wall biosynthesis
MRIVIDLQGAQGESRFRGIGRYVLAFAEAVCRNSSDHEVFLALNGSLPERIDAIRKRFTQLLPADHIRVWQPPQTKSKFDLNGNRGRQAAETIYEGFLLSFNADVIHIGSLFEGFETVTSIGKLQSKALLSITLYDLIPLLNPEKYLTPNPLFEAYYARKIDSLKKASALLAISKYAQEECAEHIPALKNQIFNVSTGVDANFRFEPCAEEDAFEILNRLGIAQDFILYTGGADDRKNLPRLIQAFAAIDPVLKLQHQLVLAGRMPAHIVADLSHVATKHGLASDKVLFLGYVDDADLIKLYALCKLFVFPSWHEGFGLPALEAMACGAPVIAANATSIPEVVGLQEALFDPYNVLEIAKKITQCLESDAFRSTLREHGLQRAQQFTWDRVGQRAIAVWSYLTHKPGAQTIASDPPRTEKPRLAFVTPLPPERTGIAYYSAILLPALAKYYEIDVIVSQDSVDDTWISENIPIRDVEWFMAHANQFDRVLYQMGNSVFHHYMIPLIREFPGVVTLHDFYMGGVMSWLENHGQPNLWSKALYASHGYQALRARSTNAMHASLHYPANFELIQRALGIIVHSDHARQLSAQWYLQTAFEKLHKIPLARNPAALNSKTDTRAQLGFKPDDFIVCSYGFLDTSKLNHRLLECWEKSRLSLSSNCYLIFVGENHGGQYGADLNHLIGLMPSASRISITGYVTDDDFLKYLTIADVGVQLRTGSRGETSAAVLDCMNHGLAVIANAHGAMAEIDPTAICMLPDMFTNDELVRALESLWENLELRLALGVAARTYISENHAPDRCALVCKEAIESIYEKSNGTTYGVINAIVKESDDYYSNAVLLDFSRAIATSLPQIQPAKRIFLDITATAHTELKTGIERVARSVVNASLNVSPAHYRSEPVYLCQSENGWRYRYARQYMCALLGIPSDSMEDDFVDFQAGDTIIALDISGHTLVQASACGMFSGLRNSGVTIYSFVHDLLPIQFPELFPPAANSGHMEWLNAVSTFDGVICVSESVAVEYRDWRESHPDFSKSNHDFKILWSAHGADLSNSSPSSGIPENSDKILDIINSHPTFLMVGTIEPRKGYAEAIDAFDTLWAAGMEVNLVIVGKEGWRHLPNSQRRNIPELITRIQTHPELNHRLFWLEGISDAFLETIYDSCTALIAASYGEGFGLPLIEAARHNLPLILRDIPVFREVAGLHAFYFIATSGTELATAIRTWLELYLLNRHPSVDSMNWLTWEDSTRHTLKICTTPIAPFVPIKASPKRRLFFDVTVTYRSDFKTGIQRVVRSVLGSLMKTPNLPFQVIPVYLDHNDSRWIYKSASVYINNGGSLTFDPEFTEISSEIFPGPGDLVVGLDLAGSYLVNAHRSGLFSQLKAQGARLYFMVHDLLPIRMPHFFAAQDCAGFKEWLMAICDADTVICNSAATESDFITWLADYRVENPQFNNPGTIHFHLGSDLAGSSPSMGLPDSAGDLISGLKGSLTFLTVGTIEPRKGYKQLLEAFESLWPSMPDIRLVIVGKRGWMMDAFCDRLANHPELGKRLFWLEGISDEYLELVYEASTCFIAPSEGEGFGIPIIEAAHHGLPIIARDLPVFREIGGDQIHYFSGMGADQLASAIKAWVEIFHSGDHPKASGIKCLTWEESTAQLLERLLKDLETNG